MFRIFDALGLVPVFVAVLMVRPAFALTPNEVPATINSEAMSTRDFQDFFAAQGEDFFKVKQGNDRSRASCCTGNPAAPGKHVRTGKVIQPFAPAADVERFTDMDKVEKWFKRNCNDVLTYLLTIRK